MDPANISVSGPMSFAPQIHGNPNLFPSFSTFTDSQPYSYVDTSQATTLKIEEMAEKLRRKLGPEFVSQRPGPGGSSKLTYIEGWKVINLANEVFGFNGWSSNIVSLTTDYMDMNEATGRINIGVTAIVKVTLRDGVFHEDVGYGFSDNQKHKGQALDKAKKEAVTDAIKRTLRNFGNLLGNCLYDSAYAKEVVKIKIPPVKFNKDDLYRRPEYQDKKPTPAHQQEDAKPAAPHAPVPAPQVKSEPTNPPVPQGRLANSTSSSSASHSRPVGPISHPNGANAPAPPRKSTADSVRAAMEKLEKERKEAEQQQSNQTATHHTAQLQESTKPVAPMNHAPQQPMRTVSFVNEDSDVFPSDDERFWETVDFGENAADMGQPILYEGEPDDDASVMASGPSALSVIEPDIRLAGGALPHHGQNHDQKPLNARPFQQQQQHYQKQQMTNPQAAARAVNSRSSTSTSGTSMYHPVAQDSERTTINPGSRKSGAFVFPPGTSEADFAAPNPPGRISLGTKRTADMMQQSHRRPVQGPGMGLNNGSGKEPHARRPLGTLSTSEGGDLKRVRR